MNADLIDDLHEFITDWFGVGLTKDFKEKLNDLVESHMNAEYEAGWADGHNEGYDEGYTDGAWMTTNRD